MPVMTSTRKVTGRDIQVGRYEYSTR
jgi:hypothetical protein